jgi:glyoxylase-like metal-dependent hydrolase (beta-lactamase superfamily II)
VWNWHPDAYSDFNYFNNQMGTKLSALNLGVFSVGTKQEFIPIEKDEQPEKGSVRLSLNPFLIENGDSIILIDTGLGSFHPGDMTHTLLEKIAAAGYSELDVTDVICSHLHLDHCGGLANKLNGYWDLTFPDAAVHLSAQEFEKVKKEKHDDLTADFVSFIEARADLQFVEDNPEPLPGIRVEITGGHTEFSLGIFGDTGGVKFLMAGDVLGVRSHVNRKFAARYDFEPAKSQELRERLLKSAFEKDALILAYHDTGGPVFRLSRYDKNKGYTIHLPEEYATI